jgi:hypothetical protein
MFWLQGRTLPNRSSKVKVIDMTGKEQKVMTGRVSIVIIPLLDESRGYIGILKSVRPSQFWFPDKGP